MSSMTGGSGLKGTGYRQINVGADPNIQALWQQLRGGSQAGIGAGLSNLSGLAAGDQSQFEALEAPAKRQFGELQGQLASRFSGMGSGARRSSGHQLAQSGAATDFAERLQSQRMGLQQSAISQLLGLGQSLLGTSLSENVLMPKKKPFWQELLGSAAGGLGQLGGTFGGYGLGKQIFG